MNDLTESQKKSNDITHIKTINSTGNTDINSIDDSINDSNIITQPHISDSEKQPIKSNQLVNVETIHIETIKPKNQAIKGSGNFFERTFSQISERMNLPIVAKSLLETLDQAKLFFQKTSDILEEERPFSISEESVNGLLGRFLVAKVRAITDMYATIHDDDFTLYVHVDSGGVKASISALFTVETFVFNDSVQKMIYCQKTPTKIESIFFDSIQTHIKVKVGLFFLEHIKKRDVLGFILEKKHLATVEIDNKKSNSNSVKDNNKQKPSMNDKVTINLSKYMAHDKAIINTLKKVNVTDASIKKGRLQLLSKINLENLL